MFQIKDKIEKIKFAFVFLECFKELLTKWDYEISFTYTSWYISILCFCKMHRVISNLNDQAYQSDLCLTSGGLRSDYWPNTAILSLSLMCHLFLFSWIKILFEKKYTIHSSLKSKMHIQNTLTKIPKVAFISHKALH